jgi:serine/threonine-protein kinase
MPLRNPEYQPGQQVPGTVYRVMKVLGAGGMGTVYEVEDTSIGKKYVLKTLHGDLAERKDLAQRLAREARALAKLQHPNIVEVYTSGTTNDNLRLPFYVMERLQGSSLRVVLETKGRLMVEQACDIGIDLLDALDHAHEFGIIHRDVKPDNIFICRARDGRSLAKLLDFGIIKLAGPGTATLHTGGRFIGTFRYAPPEQMCNRDVTPRSDLYAAGLVLYEMIAGRGPFDDFTGEMEIGKAHIDIPAPPLSRFIDVPHALEQAIMASLEKDPALRPPDAFTFGATLRAIKRSFSGGATMEQIIAPPSAARPATPFLGSTEAPEIIPPSDGETRVDGPAAMIATTVAPTRVTHTVSLGVLPLDSMPPRVDTYAAAPITAAVVPVPAFVDRRAETRAAAPQPVAQPSYDTSPIPLAILAPRPATPPVETFRPHTTEASQRKKATRIGLAIAAVATVVVSVAVAVVVVATRHRSTRSDVVQSMAPTTTVTATDPTVEAAPVIPSVSPQPSVAASVEVAQVPVPVVVALPKHVAVPTHAPSTANAARSAASTAPSAIPINHRVGSGL